MLTRCPFSIRLSKPASTSQRISRPSRRRPSSLSTAGCSSIRCFSKGTPTPLDVRPSKAAPKIDWPSESWDDIFSDLDKEPVKPRKPSIRQAQDDLYSKSASPNSNMMHSFYPKPVQRQTLTKRERDTLTEMVDWILKPETKETDIQGRENTTEGRSVASGEVNDLVGRLRQFTRKPKKTRKSNESLDQKLEEMSLCTTDVQLLEWASREVFEESTRLAEQATSAMAEAARTGRVAEISLLQSPIYPDLIAHLIRTFRVQYQDLNLALSIFDHAKRLSTLSFVFGCSTDSYNEFIETQWMLSRDLEVIHTSIEEMIVNGVSPNAKTRRLIENFRQEVSFTRASLGTDGIQDKDMDMLIKIERLLAPTRRSKANPYEEWKSDMIGLDETEIFNNWKPKKEDRQSGFQYQPNERERESGSLRKYFRR